MRLPAILFSACLLALVIALLALHVRTWRRVRREGADPAELRFGWRQFRRRMQASTMLGIVALAIPMGSLIPYRERPSLFVFFWFGVAMLVIWVLVLAMLDMFATARHGLHTSRRNLVEEAKLRAQLDRHHLGGGNGHHETMKSGE